MSRYTTQPKLAKLALEVSARLHRRIVAVNGPAGWFLAFGETLSPLPGFPKPQRVKRPLTEFCSAWLAGFDAGRADREDRT